MDHNLYLEYVFFHEQPCAQFKKFLQERDIALIEEAIDETDIRSYLLYIEDEVEEKLGEEIEAFYDEMMALSESLTAAEDDAREMSRVGLAVSVADGRSVLVSVDPDVLNRVLTVITHDELGKLVEAIADAVENPDERPLCKR